MSVIEGTGVVLDTRVEDRRRRAAALERRRETAFALGWLAGTGTIAFMLASGTVDVTTVPGFLTTLGRLAGIVASTTILCQLILIGRIPWVERYVGHDKAARLHGQLGRMGFLFILAHLVFIVTGYALSTRSGVLDQAWSLVVDYGGPMFLAWAGFILLTAVVVTSLALMRSRWSYEDWHVVHLFAYVAIGFSVPHQFTDGSTFREMGWGWWYWLVLWTVAVGGLLVFRVIRPLVLLRRHDLRVAALDRLADGSIVVTMSGRDLTRLGPRPGQFLLFRFLDRERWAQAHPYSLSRAPLDGWLRITVKPLGDGSAGLANLRVGTRVMVEGPLGTMTEDSRAGDHLVLAGAGVGITPVLALLEGAAYRPGECTVIVRASSIAEAPHLDEIRAIATARGARLYELIGHRGASWGAAGAEAPLPVLVPEIAGADVYACGPEAWADALLAEARACGVSEDRLHREEFVW
ncbi:ferredoxin reductase family protein [Demequina pelophila]|uniref:ferredoxin reductase family protein n=1 Tax=Demequina pelophila TaxID=1638984 RepID=UPI0007860C7D|nr:ferredoxin reductase family protein [Demequina pelophila]